jgi:hypothetical protein
MSRPTSYHDPTHYVNIEDGYDANATLPLFNHHPNFAPPSIPPIRTSNADEGTQNLPPPPSARHQARHSSYQPLPSTLASPFGAGANYSGAPYEERQTHRSAMTSSLPYSTVSYPQQGHPSQQDELMPPTASTSFGSLARSASLGAGRKKDQFTYASDDVESGMGSMEVEPRDGAWGGYAAGFGRGQPQGYAQHQTRDVDMSPGSSGRPYSSHNTNMNPPPVPAHALRPDLPRIDSTGSSPHAYQSHALSASMSNPYVPRGAEANMSPGQGQWLDYRRSSTNQLSTSSSYHSPSSDQLSPYSRADGQHSPGMAYDMSPASRTQMQVPINPSSPGGQYADSHHHSSPSNAYAPPPNHRSQSHQLYPASQPATPAAKAYDMGPPRSGMPSRGGQSRDGSSAGSSSKRGFRDVKDWQDLKPVVNNNPNGRRADPDAPGKYLSVSLA